VFVVLYSLIFVSQPLNAISPIDQKFFELIVPIATFLTGTLSGIMLSGSSKEDKEAMLAAQKQANENFEATKKQFSAPATTSSFPKPAGMPMGMPPAPSFGAAFQPPSFGAISPLAEATTMPVFEDGDPTHRNSRND
jgi:hypothetical protein